MAQVTIYTKPFCPFCVRAVSLLEKKGVAFDAEKKAEMMEKSGGRATFPQIFIGDTHVGGCDDMMALEQAGKLDPLLAA